MIMSKINPTDPNSITDRQSPCESFRGDVRGLVESELDCNPVEADFRSREIMD